MLIILLTWTIITVLAYPAGVLLHALLRWLFRLKVTQEHFSLYCISGLLVAGFVSTLLCLFIPLGLVSNLCLLALAFAGCIFNRKVMRACLRNDLQRLQNGHWAISLLVFLFILIISYLCYLPSSHHDDGLYYSTSIKWLQEYGTVKGLANLNARIGFNSSWHILQANFGFQFLHAGLFNDLNGLLFIWMLLYAVAGINDLIKGDNRVRNGARALIMMPVLLFHFGPSSDVMLYNVNFLSSPAADIPGCLLIWLICLLFMDSGDSKQEFQLPDVLVALYSAWALSIKLSSLPVVLLTAYTMVRLFRTQRRERLLSLTLLCFLFLLPWLCRNVLVSGYLFFPFPGIDLFPVAWKLPLSQVKWHENAVRAFAVQADLERPFNIPFTQWFPEWFSKAKRIQQLSLWVSLAATAGYAVTAVYKIWLRDARFFKCHAKEIACLATCLAGILFWLYKAPDFRFGYGFICFYCMYFLARVCRYFLKDNLHYLYLPIGVYMAAVAVFYYRDRWMSARRLFGKPLEYRMPSRQRQIPLSRNLQLTIVSGEDSWNAPLPVANEHEFTLLHTGLIGESIRQGFKATRKEISTP